MMAGVLITSIGSGQLISKFGRYRPFPIAGTAIMAVGLVLLSRLEVDTSTLVAGGYMLVLGLGLGMVMQVLVLAAQNAVDYKYLGVATLRLDALPPDRRLDRRRGLRCRLREPARGQPRREAPGRRALPAAPNPAAIKQLPPAAHAAYVTAITDALQPVFARRRRSGRARLPLSGSCPRCR